jgi:hypothetical protein
LPREKRTEAAATQRAAVVEVAVEKWDSAFVLSEWQEKTTAASNSGMVVGQEEMGLEKVVYMACPGGEVVISVQTEV